MNLTDNAKARAVLLDFFKKKCLPCFDTYFEKVVEKRERENTWHNNSPWDDMFKPYAIRDPQNANKAEGTLACVLAAPRSFWDTWLAVYQLENPELFYNQSVVAKILVEKLQAYPLHPEGILNLIPNQVQHLMLMAAGEQRNKFIQDPLTCYYGLRFDPVIETSCPPGANVMDWMLSPEAEKVGIPLRKECELMWRDEGWGERFRQAIEDE